jgi:hypothetical protein
VQAPDVWDGHYDEYEVEDYVRDGAAEVDRAGWNAFCAYDGDVPCGFDGDAGEDYAEELGVCVSTRIEEKTCEAWGPREIIGRKDVRLRYTRRWTWQL